VRAQIAADLEYRFELELGCSGQAVSHASMRPLGDLGLSKR
jgi:hypothetical protein